MEDAVSSEGEKMPKAGDMEKNCELFGRGDLARQGMSHMGRIDTL